MEVNKRYEYGFDEGRKHLQARYILDAHGFLHIKIYGSDHWTDWFTNFLMCRRKGWDNNRIKFHRGWYYYAFRFYRELRKEIDWEKTKFLIIRGHSMGGAVAVILRGFFNLPAIVKMYNAPTPVNEAGAQVLRRFGDKIERWWHWNDIVHKLPPKFLGYSQDFGRVYRYGERSAPFWKAHNVLTAGWDIEVDW